jgi:large subunit ribosomal protein L13
MEKDWYFVDAEGKTLGRLAVRIAQVLSGKHKPTFVPHQDVGDFVIVTNAEKVKVTGQKEEQKRYYRHSQYPGGLKEVSLKEMRAKHPERIIALAVKGMLPQNKLRDRRLKKLKIYVGSQHPHQAQDPKPLIV